MSQSSTMIIKDSNLKHHKSSSCHWKTLKNVLRASNSLRCTQAKVVNDVDELISELKFKNFEAKTPQPKSLVLDAIDQFRADQKLLNCIQRSSTEDLVEIRSLIENHPSRYIRNSSDSNSFLNKENFFGIRPLYEACRNGHKDTVLLLIELGANPKLISNGENCLQVTCRWNHFEILKILLSHAKWNENQLRVGMKETKNKFIIEYIKGFLPRFKPWFFCCGHK